MYSNEKIKEMYVLFVNGYTLAEIGLMYQLSGERIRQLLYKQYGESAGRRFGGISKRLKPVRPEQARWYRQTKYNALKQGSWPWELAKEDIPWTDVCPLSNKPINWDAGKVSMDSPSLRRLDRSKGYTKDNVQLVRYEENLKYIWRK